MITSTRATIEDLYRVPGKAELVEGEIVHMSPTGAAPNYAAVEILVSLRGYARRTKAGYAVGDNAAFRVNLPNRESFSPDAAFHVGRWTGMKFFEGSPVLAVEVRSEGDYGPAAEKRIAQKRVDYFAGGTLIVWDVDLLDDDVIKSYSRLIRAEQLSSAAARWPMLNPRCLDGRCRWTISLSNRHGNNISYEVLWITPRENY